MPLKRIEFLGKVKKSLRIWGGEHHPPLEEEELARARLVEPGESKVETFCTNAEDGGMNVIRAGEDWEKDLLSLLKEKKCRKVLTDAMSLLGSTSLWNSLKEEFEWTDWTECRNPAAASFEADCGVTAAAFAVAETGSLALFASPERSRLTSLAPPIHIALVKEEQILPDLLDFYTELGARSQADFPSHITLITGPSKTSDIEMTLVKGVHGPLEVHVILI
jgi:L-lactate dehydrogenase complex protein LldG